MRNELTLISQNLKIEGLKEKYKHSKYVSLIKNYIKPTKETEELFKDLKNAFKWLGSSAKNSEYLYCALNNITEFTLCKQCKINKVKFINIHLGYKKFCSNSCAASNIETLQKKLETDLKLYGVDHSSKNSEVKDKMKKTNLLKYGVHHNSQIALGEDKLKVIDDINWLIEENKTKSLVSLSKEIGVDVKTITKRFNDNELDINRFWNSSANELELCDFVDSLGVDYYRSDREILKPKELDIYIPDSKLAIEFNGLYWHSSKPTDNSLNSYHLEKTVRCQQLDISLLHIFENEWEDKIKKNIWKSMIKSKLGIISNKIPARKCSIKKIDVNIGKEFFDVNHIQGGLNTGEHIGLFFNEILVACISFGISRFNKKETELYRFANKVDCLVVGGFSKLLKLLPKPIISYANRRWSNGNVYIQNGFDLLSETKPNYFYFISHKLYSRNKFQKHRLKNMKFFDESLTEKEIMELNGYRIIHDCGNLKFKISEE